MAWSATDESGQKSQTVLSLFCLNENSDFSQGLDHWAALHREFPPPPPSSKWGYEIKRGEYGEIWMENPDDRTFDHVVLAQGAWSHPDLPKSGLYLKDHPLRLEADVMVVQDERLPGKTNSYSRVAIAFDCKKIDGSTYSSQYLFPDSIFSEYDVYRRNIAWGCETKDVGVITYHADQIPVGQWRHYSMHVNDFFLTGFGLDECGGWERGFYEKSYLNMWYLVIENLASITRARLRNVELYEA